MAGSDIFKNFTGLRLSCWRHLASLSIESGVPCLAPLSVFLTDHNAIIGSRECVQDRLCFLKCQATFGRTVNRKSARVTPALLRFRPRPRCSAIAYGPPFWRRGREHLHRLLE